MILPALFHWSPTERRADILLHGLVPGSLSCVAFSALFHVCLSPTPSQAWGLSGGTGWTDVERWDLWQVRLSEHDQVHIKPMFGDVMEEVTVRNPIPAERMWWVATRDLANDP